MVIDLDTYAAQRQYRKVRIAGAYDIEPDWWSVDTNGDFLDERFIEPTNEWANGYLSVRGVRPYYNYGSLDGGPRDSSWLNPLHPRSQQFNQTLADVYALSTGKRRRALPQIYNAAYAKEWYQLRRYSILRRSEAITLAGVMTQTGSSTRVFTDARPWQAFKLDLVNSDGTIENLPPRQGWQAMHDALHRTLIQPLTLTSNLGSPLPDSFLVAPYAAPSPTFTIAPTATCQPNYSPYDSALPYRFYGELSCFPAGTTFPQDTTFSTRFVLPSQYQPVFSAVTRQPLPWATDIQYGCLVSRCREEQLPRQ